MPIRIPKVSIVVLRDGIQLTPEINKPFDFTKEEIADVEGQGNGYLVAEDEGDTGGDAGADGKKLTKAQHAAASKAAKDAEVVGATGGDTGGDAGATGGETL